MSDDPDLPKALRLDLDMVESIMAERVADGVLFPPLTEGNALRLVFIRIRHAEAEEARLKAEVAVLKEQVALLHRQTDARSREADRYFDIAMGLGAL